MSEIRHLTGGSASATVSGKNVALNQFNSMQRLRKQPEFTDISEDEVCSVELFQIFARYVTETVTTAKDKKEKSLMRDTSPETATVAKDKKEKLLMRDTYTQYVSGDQNLAFARFPKNEIWVTERICYTKLRSVIAAAVNRRQIQLGLSVRDKSDAVDHSLLTSITKVIMKVRYVDYRGSKSKSLLYSTLSDRLVQQRSHTEALPWLCFSALLADLEKLRQRHGTLREGAISIRI